MKKLIPLFVCFALIFSLVACTTPTEAPAPVDAPVDAPTAVEPAPTEPPAAEEPAATEPPAAEQKTIGVLLKYRGDEYYKDTELSFLVEAEKRGYKIDVQSAENDLNKQVEQMETMIANKVDMILLAAMDPDGIVPTVEQANAAGIPIIGFDQPANGGEIVTDVAWIQYDAGHLIGQWVANYIKENLDGKAKVAMCVYTESGIVMTRAEGFKDALTEAGLLDNGVEVVAEQHCKISRSDVMPIAENMLLANPEIDIFYGMWDEQAFGISAALEAAGRQAVVVSSGCWGLEAFNKLANKDPLYTAATLVDVFSQGKTVFDAVDAYFAGKPLERTITFPLTAIDQTNVTQFADPTKILELRAKFGIE